MDGFKLYGEGARKFKTISSDETKKLFEENSKLARSKIFEGNLPLVAFVITNKFYRAVDKEELFQVGSLGLWEAILNFNVSFGAEFSSYATSMIEGRIRSYIRNNGHAIKIPRPKMDLSNKIFNLQEEYGKRNSGSELSTNELSKLLKVPINEIEDAILSRKDIVSLDEPVYQPGKDENEIFLGDQVFDSDYKIYEEYEYKELLKEIKNLIDDMPETQQIIIKRFLNDNVTQAQLAEQLGISRSLVSRYITKFKETVKKKIGYKDIHKKEVGEKKQNQIKKTLTIYEKLEGYEPKLVDYMISRLENSKRELLLDRYPKKLEGFEDKLDAANRVKARQVLKELTYNLALEKVKANGKSITNEGGILTMKEKSNQSKTEELLKFFEGKTKEEILDSLEKLGPINKGVMEYRFGLNGKNATKAEDIARIFSIKKSQVYSIVNYSKAKMRSIMDKTYEKNSNDDVEIKIKNTSKLKFDFPGVSEDKLSKVLKEISKRPREVFILVYGLVDGIPLKVKDAALKLGITEKNASQQLYIAKKKLKEILVNEIGVSSLVKEENEPKEELKQNNFETINDVNYSKPVNINDIKKKIKDGKIGTESIVFNSGDSVIKVDVTMADCTLALVNTKKNFLNRAKSISKKCYVYKISVIDKLGNIVKQDVLIKDKKFKKFYNYITTDKDGNYRFDNILSDEIVCYEIAGSSKIENSKIKNEETEKKKRITIEEYIKMLYEDAIYWFNDKDIIKAENNFKKLLEITSDNNILYNSNFHLGKIYKKRKKYIIAERFFESALNYDEDYFAFLELGRVKAAQGKYEEALKTLEECDKHNNSRIDHMIEMAKIFNTLGRSDLAIKTLDSCISYRKNDYMAHNQKAMVLYEKKMYDDALEEIDVCERIRPYFNNHMLIKGKILYEQGNKADAFKIFDECVKQDQEKNIMYSIVNIGYYFHKQGKEDLAYKYYKETPMFPKWINLSKNEIERHFEKHKLNINKEKMHSVFNINLSLDEVEQYIKYMEKTGIKELYDVYQIYWPGIGNMVIDEGETKKEDYLTIYTLPFTKKIMMCYPDFRFSGEIINEPISIDELKQIGITKKEVENVAESSDILETKDLIENIKDDTLKFNNSSDKEEKIELLKNTESDIDEKMIGVKIPEEKVQEPGNLYVDDERFKSEEAQGENIEVYVDDEVNKNNGEITLIPKEFGIPLLNSFEENKDNFRALINLLSNPTEQVVLLLRLGYVEDRCYSIEEISNALGFDENKIKGIIETALSNIMGVSSITINSVESARKQLRIK